MRLQAHWTCDQPELAAILDDNAVCKLVSGEAMTLTTVQAKTLACIIHSRSFRDSLVDPPSARAAGKCKPNILRGHPPAPATPRPSPSTAASTPRPKRARTGAYPADAPAPAAPASSVPSPPILKRPAAARRRGRRAKHPKPEDPVEQTCEHIM